MHKAHLYVLIGVMLLLSVAVSILTTADVNSGYECGQDNDCEILSEDPSEVYYCKQAEGMCYLQEELETIAPPEEESLPPPEPTLEDRIAQVHAEISTLQDSIDTTKTTSSNIQDRLTTIEQKLASVESSSKTAAQQFTAQGKAVETGLTGLQKEVNETKTEVSALGESSTLIKYIFFILMIAAIALGLIYYVNRKPPTTVHPHVLAYITKHIKEGKKFSFIKESLQKAGWAEEEIARAYTETIKHNYEKYAQQRAVAGGMAGATVKPGAVKPIGGGGMPAPAVRPATTKRQNQNKVIGIAVVTILLLLGVFFLLSGTVGKAVFYQQEVLEKTREITQKIECTSPHILTPDGDACCLDENNNNVCDTTEERQAQVRSLAGQNFEDKVIEVPNKEFTLKITESGTGLEKSIQLDPSKGKFVAVTFWGDKFIIQQTKEEK